MQDKTSVQESRAISINLTDRVDISLPHEQCVPLSFKGPPLDLRVEFEMGWKRRLPRHKVAVQFDRFS